MDTLSRFSTLFDKGGNFYDFLFAFLLPVPLWKEVYSKRKEFAPQGEQILSF